MKHVRQVMPVVGAIMLVCGVPVCAEALQAADEKMCPEVQRCLQLLEDGIDLVAAGRWDAASVVLGEVAAGLEEHPFHARDLARAYVHLGAARLQVGTADETRQLFAEARVLDPGLEPDPTGFSREALEIWDESREAGTTVVGVADDVSAGIRIRAEAVAAGVPADVLTTAERFSADTAKKMGRSMWRTLVGVLSITAGIVVAGRQCDLDGAERWDDGAQVETLGGVVRAIRLGAAPYGRSKYVRWGADCRLRYRFELNGRYGTVRGHVEDHDAMLRESGYALTLALALDEELRGSYVEGMRRESSPDAASFDERLKQGLAESVGEVSPGLFFPKDRLAGGLVLAGLGALILTKWSDTVVVEDVAFAVTPGGGVLASRSFGW